MAGDDLTEGETDALRNLLKKQSGGEVAFINIADARVLTEHGLAARTQQGWAITEAGVRRLAELAQETPSSASPPAST